MVIPEPAPVCQNIHLPGKYQEICVFLSMVGRETFYALCSLVLLVFGPAADY
jgi:hypothetical protein